MTTIVKDDLIDSPLKSGSHTPAFLTVLWRRKALVLFGVVCGVALGWLYYLQRPATYQSTAQLMVLKRKVDTTSMNPSAVDSRVSFVEDYVATQEALIQSHEVLRRAADHLQNEPLRMRPANGDLITYLFSGLKISRPKDVSNTNVLNISFQGPAPEDCAAIVKAVIEGYRDSLTGAVNTVTDDNLKTILKGREETDKKLEESVKEYQKVRERIRNSSSLSITDLTALIGINQAKLSELSLLKIGLEDKIAGIEQKLAPVQSKTRILALGGGLLGPITDRLAAGVNRAQILALAELGTMGRKERVNEVLSQTADDPLFKMLLQEEEMLQRLGKDHPEVQVMMKRRELTKNHLSKKSLSSSLADDKADAKEDELDLLLQHLKDELATNNRKTAELEKSLENDRKTLKVLQESVDEDKLIQDQRDLLRKQLNNLDERKQQIDLTRDAPLFDALVITPAGTGVKVSPVLISTVGLAGFLGLLFGSGLAYLSEMTDNSFHSLEEVRSRLGLPLIGQIPVLIPHEPAEVVSNPFDPLLTVHHNPRSMEAEAYRGVRTSLFFNTRGKGHQVIQVTSPNPGEGKSTFTANLAVALAHSGKRVILIDADMRKPRVHQIFGITDDETGLASVISGEATLDEAIQGSGIQGLSILPSGVRPANPADLLSSTLFQEVLNEIKQEYDFVLIDTPPLLAVSDPSVVTARVDGVILLLRMTKNSRAAAEQAKDRLAILGANVLGVVANSTESNTQAYGYGQGYGYSEAYGDDLGAATVSLSR